MFLIEAIQRQQTIIGLVPMCSLSKNLSFYNHLIQHSDILSDQNIV